LVKKNVIFHRRFFDCIFRDAKKRKAAEMNEIREKGNAILYGTANHSDDESDEADSQNGDAVVEGSDGSEDLVDSENDEDLNDSDDEEEDVAAKYENSLRKGAWQKDEKVFPFFLLKSKLFLLVLLSLCVSEERAPACEICRGQTDQEHRGRAA
jgi:hypothetical protein